MDSNYGVIPANSYVLKEVIVYPISDKIRVNIKFAKSTIIPNFRSETTKFKKWKSTLIKLTDEEISTIIQENQNRYNNSYTSNNKRFFKTIVRTNGINKNTKIYITNSNFSI